MNIFEKIEYFPKKDAERFGGFKNNTYLCNPFRNQNAKLF